jgi:hypothetical protein
MQGMMQHMADMQRHMTGLMGVWPPSASPPASPDKKMSDSSR